MHVCVYMVHGYHKPVSETGQSRQAGSPTGFDSASTIVSCSSLPSSPETGLSKR